MCFFNFWICAYKCHFCIFYLVKLSNTTSLNLVSPAGWVGCVCGGCLKLSIVHTQCATVVRRFLNNVWENDGSLVNNVGAMHRRLPNIVWTNDGRLHNNVWTNDRRLHIQCWLNDRRLVVFTSLLDRVSPVWLASLSPIPGERTAKLGLPRSIRMWKEEIDSYYYV